MSKPSLGVLLVGAAIATTCALLGTASAAGASPSADADKAWVDLGLQTTSRSSTFAINDHIGLFGTFKSSDVPAYGPEVEIIRTDSAHPDGILVQTVTFQGGVFQTADWPLVSGTVTYTIAYPGDDTHVAADTSLTVTVTQQKPDTLTLNHNGATYNYGATVPFTAHLDHWDTYRNVAIMHRVAGSTGNYLGYDGLGPVDPGGNLTASLKLTNNTEVRAAYNGDAWDMPAVANVTVNVHASVSMSLSRQYKTTTKSTGTHSYFHQSVNPYFTTTMNPYPNRRQYLTIDYYAGGTWHPVKSGYYLLNGASKSYVTFSWAKKLNVCYRVRSAYVSGSSGDKANVTTYGAYRYFYFTK